MTSERAVYLNGSFVPEHEASLGIFDTALTTGEKAVEVSRTFNHNIFELDAHLTRLYEVMAMLDIDTGIGQDELAGIAEDTLGRNLPTEDADVDWQVNYYVTKGATDTFGIVPADEQTPTVLVHCFPLLGRIGKMAAKYTDGADLITVGQRAMPQDVLTPQIKSTGRMDHVLGRLEAKRRLPGSTGVLLDREGFITEGTGASLFIVSDGVIKTAPTTRVLDGLTRQLVFDVADDAGVPIEEADLRPEDAQSADEIFTTSTVICQVHARSFDGKAVGNGKLGKVSEVIRQGFSREVGLDFAAQALRYGARLQEMSEVST